MRRVLKCSLAVLAVSLALPAVASADSVIDFEGLGEGKIVSSLASGAGISGDPLSGSATVLGTNPSLPGNTALVFDATCTATGGGWDGAGEGGTPANCSGSDADLFKPELSKVLIVAENLRDNNANNRVDSPDDADVFGQSLDFDLAGLGSGNHTIQSITVLDVEGVEAGGKIQAFDDGQVIADVPIPVNGDNVASVIAIGAEGADRLKVILGGSAAIDNIRLSSDSPPEQPGAEGCTPGYWKNHTDRWTGFTPSQLYNTVFGVSYTSGLTLLGALNQGGGGFEALGRHSTAALLNAAHGEVDFGLSTSQVIALVQQAFASGNPEPIKNQLAALNEQGCPLGGTSATKKR